MAALLRQSDELWGGLVVAEDTHFADLLGGVEGEGIP